MNTHLFFRQDGFYPLELKNDQDAKWNAENNPGTVRVETIAGNIIWADNNRWN
jgi:hypothetical protein